MIDFIDEVKNFYPKEITDQSLWKYCEEFMVMATLIYLFPEKYFKLNHSDQPDLQLESEIGIEVTQCLEQKINKSIGVWTSYRANNKVSFDKCEEKIKEQGGTLTSFGIIHAVSTEETQMVPIKAGIDKKTELLKKYRDKFKECSLAIILEEPIRTIPQKAIDYFKYVQSKYNEKFDSLIIIANRFVISYDLKLDHQIKIEYTRQEKNWFQNAGVLMVHKKFNKIQDCFKTSKI